MTKLIWRSAGWKERGEIEVYVEGGRAIARIYRDHDRSVSPIEIRGEDLITAASAILTERKAVELLMPDVHRDGLPRTAIERALVSFLCQLSPDDHKAQGAIGGWVRFICFGPYNSINGMVGYAVRRDNPHLVDLINAITKYATAIRGVVKTQRVLLQDEAGADTVESYGWAEEVARHPKRGLIADALRETGRFVDQEPLVRQIARALTGGLHGVVSWRDENEVGAFLKENSWAQEAVRAALQSLEEGGAQ